MVWQIQIQISKIAENCQILHRLRKSKDVQKFMRNLKKEFLLQAQKCLLLYESDSWFYSSLWRWMLYCLRHKKSEKLKNDGENYDSNTILASHCEKEKNIFSNYNYLVHILNFTS